MVNELLDSLKCEVGIVKSNIIYGDIQCVCFLKILLQGLENKIKGTKDLVDVYI